MLNDIFQFLTFARRELSICIPNDLLLERFPLFYIGSNKKKWIENKDLEMKAAENFYARTSITTSISTLKFLSSIKSH